MRKNILFLLMLGLLNISCSRFFHIAKEDITEYDRDNQIKLLLKDGDEIIGEKFSFNASKLDTSIVLISGQKIDTIPMSEIEKFYINKIDYPMTIFTSFWILVGVLFVFAAIAFQGFSIGG